MNYLPHAIIALQWISIVIIIGNLNINSDLHIRDFSNVSFWTRLSFILATLIHFYAVVDDGIFLYRVMINNEEHLFKKYSKDEFLDIVKSIESFPVVSAIKLMAILPYWEFFIRKMRYTGQGRPIRHLFFLVNCCIVGLLICIAGVSILF